MKRCYQCRRRKPLTEFYKQAAAADGLQAMCKKCTERNRKAFDAKCLAEGRATRSTLGRYALRMEVLLHYSAGDLRCACPGCTVTEFEFLALDHVNGGGAAHRREVGQSAVYQRLKQDGFPAGFRVLCHNCNASHGYYGYCPHTSPSEASARALLLTNKQRSEQKLLRYAAELSSRGLPVTLKVLKKEHGMPISFASTVRKRLLTTGQWPYEIATKFTPKCLKAS